MKLLQRKIMYDGKELGELAYLGYTQETEGSVVRFLLKTYYINTRPLSDVIGIGKDYMVEVVLNVKDDSFERLYILKHFMSSSKKNGFSTNVSSAVTHPDIFLISTIRKMVKKIKRAAEEKPIECAAF